MYGSVSVTVYEESTNFRVNSGIDGLGMVGDATHKLDWVRSMIEATIIKNKQSANAVLFTISTNYMGFPVIKRVLVKVS